MEMSCTPNNDGLTILLASDDLDRAFLAFMIAASARTMNMNVNIFFALWGVNLLRRNKDEPSMLDVLENTDEDDDNEKKKKSLMNQIMGLMMTKGPENAQLSKHNFGGMGASMMKTFIQKSGAASLPELMDMAVSNGVTFTICSLTLEIMGLSLDEIIGLPNLSCGGITACLGEALNSKVFLVI